MENLNISTATILDLIMKHPKGMVFDDRITILSHDGMYQTYELIVLSKSYVKQHPWDEKISDGESWLTKTIADICVRYLDLEEIDQFHSPVLTFEKNSDVEIKKSLRAIEDYCRNHYGFYFKFLANKIDYTYSWKWESDNPEWIHVSILKIDVNYVFVIDYFNNH